MANTQRSSTNTSLVFNVARRPPELIAPARPTPHEFKELSDIDDQDGLRFQVPVIQFYRGDENHSVGSSILRGRDPCRVIREAVAKALVAYYPFAGRLREKRGRKLVVECNGEGVMFIEADANVRLEEFGDVLQPPFPCLEELLYNVPGSTDILNTPLLLIQVTRLECGGFILAYRSNHTMADAPGLVQFMKAAAELACGAVTLSIQPVWDRHLLCARNPPEITCEHHEYEDADTEARILPLDDMVYKTFFFGPTEIAALRRYIPTHPKSSTYEIIMACIWRCRTIALQCDPEEVVRLMLIVNIRTRPFNPPFPKGYYGNAFAFPAALSTASKLCGNPIGYAVDLVKRIKANVTEEYMMSLADFMVLKGRPCFTLNRVFLVSDVSRAGFDAVDFGWGPPTYGGPAESWANNMPGVVSFYTSFKTKEGEKGVAVPMCLPSKNMKIFIQELNGLLSNAPNGTLLPSNSSSFISSSL